MTKYNIAITIHVITVPLVVASLGLNTRVGTHCTWESINLYTRETIYIDQCWDTHTHTHTHTHTQTYTHTHTSVPELHHHWVEWSMLSTILPSSQASVIQHSTGETLIYTSVLSSVQIEICDGYQMRSTTGS